ncbi:MAG: hypothetical protein DHS20C05_05160 [Hyphococcus sp.]|nr:MAG: hypothetical protein DHS20C05_05160 [Marinicaulis sp.]
MTVFDTLIRNAQIFDGTGKASETGDIAIKDGKIAARGRGFPAEAKEVIDGAGHWLFPGFLDIHTHYDLEVELSPGLPESVRHGTTTVVVSNCSLGLAFGAQRENGQDPIVDCFARVENIPKPVLSRVADKVTWADSGDYLTHLDGLNLGPNIVPMIPYSMLRIAAMGVTPSVTRDPTPTEMSEMERLLDKGMREGYAGFSSDGLPFHYLSNDPNREHRVPSQYASFNELKRLTNIVREYGRVWQATPPTESPLKVFKTFLLTSGRLYKKTLKITAVAALDVRSDRNIIRSAHLLTRLLNSSLLKGQFALQTLAARFKVWSDGPYTPLAEEIPEFRALAMLDIEDCEGRQKLYSDPQFESHFKEMWRKGKSGFSLARIQRLLRMEDLALRRAPEEMVVENAPVGVWKGDNFSELTERIIGFQQSGAGARDEEERAAFEKFPAIEDDADFVFHAFRLFDRDLYWHTVSANADPKMVSKLTMNPIFLPGFADSGAHLTNMAFYDVNLRALKIAHEARGEDGVAYMAKRLTRDAADFFGVDAGRIEIGDAADLVLINPEALLAHDAEAKTQRIYRDVLQHDQLVNRSDGVVGAVFIAGEKVWSGDRFSAHFESRKLGKVLRAKDYKMEPGILRAAE